MKYRLPFILTLIVLICVVIVSALQFIIQSIVNGIHLDFDYEDKDIDSDSEDGDSVEQGSSSGKADSR